MHNLKKVVAVIAVLAMVLGTMVTGFAATVGLTPASDIAGTEYADAAARLQALGVMIGYPDGTFKPANPVTRTEFATTVDRVLGLESAAKLAGGTKPAFSDVNADYQWAWGYINTAVSNAIVNGYPDGTFKPGNQVTFAEAAAMLVRALGYEPSVTGVWPTNYLSKAAELGILDGVKATPDGAATRGDVALMVDNSLEVKMMERSTYGDTAEYVVGDKTLLTDKLNIEKVEGRVVETPSVNSSLDAEVVVDPDDEDLKEETYGVVEAINPDALLGLDVTAWVNDDDDIFYVEYDESQVKKDALDGVDTESEEVSLYIADDDFDVADDAVLYVNGDKVNLDDLAELYDDGDGSTIYGNFVFDNNEVVFANLQQFGEVDGEVVTEVDEDNELITTFDENGSENEIDLTDPDEYVITDAAGAVMTLGDIEANDVVYVADYDDTYHVVVVRNAVTGTLEKVKSDEVTVEGEGYDVSGNATYSLDEDEEIDTYASGYDSGDISDAVGEEVTLLLNVKGEVRHLTTAVGVTASNYGLVSLVDDYRDEIKIYDPVQDKNVSYEFDGSIYKGEDDIDISDLKGLTSDGDAFVVVKYELDKDNVITDLYVFGTITKDEYDIENPSEYEDLNVANITVEEFNDDHDWIETADDSYYMNSSTPILGFTYDDDDDDDEDELPEFSDVEAVKWDDIKANNAKGAQAVVVYDDKNDVEFLVITEGYENIYVDEYLGVVLDKFIDGDGDWAAEIAVWDEGTADYKLQSKTAVNVGDVVNFRVNSDGEVYHVGKVTLSDSVTVKDKDSSSLTVTDATYEKTYKLDSDTLYFDATDGFDADIDTAKLSDIKEKSLVKLVTEGKLAKLVFLVSDETDIVTPKVTGIKVDGTSVVDGKVTVETYLANQTTEKMNVFVTATDDKTASDKLTVKVGSVNATYNSTAKTYVADINRPTTAGDYSLTISVKDEAGNENKVTVIVHAVEPLSSL